MIIRLNQPSYNAAIFTRAGFKHVDLYFPDGTVPDDAIIKKFF